MRLLTGLPAVGKTTVASGLAARGYHVVNLGSLMLQAASEMGLSMERDGLRQLDSRTRETLRTASLKFIDPSDILDIHLTVRTSRGLEASVPPGLPAVTQIVILEAEPEVLLQRRAGRIGRNDPTDDSATIAEQQRANRLEASRLAGPRVAIVDASRPPNQVLQDVAEAFGPP